jgi:hypothetical protein
MRLLAYQSPVDSIALRSWSWTLSLAASFLAALHFCFTDSSGFHQVRKHQCSPEARSGQASALDAYGVGEPAGEMTVSLIEGMVGFGMSVSIVMRIRMITIPMDMRMIAVVRGDAEFRPSDQCGVQIVIVPKRWSTTPN